MIYQNWYNTLTIIRDSLHTVKNKKKVMSTIFPRVHKRKIQVTTTSGILSILGAHLHDLRLLQSIFLRFILLTEDFSCYLI